MLRFTEIASKSQATSNLLHNDNAPIKGIRAKAGATSAPSMSFADDPDTGIFNPGSNIIGIVAGSNMAIMASPSNIVTQKQMVISSNIVPADNAVQYIGTSNLHFKEAWIDTIHISQNTLYLGDTPVLGTESDSIAIRADTDQSINVKTTGLGVTNLTSTKGVNVAVSGLNSVVDIQSSGAGGRVVMGATTEVALNAPTTTVGSNLTIQGNLTVNRTQFTANVQTVEIKDNILLVNKGQTGSGVSAGFAGMRVDRGDAVNYDLLFNESNDKFEIGPVGSLAPIATETYVTNAVASVATGSMFSSNTAVYASNLAGSALPKSGGTLTGAILAGSNAQLSSSAFAGEFNQHQFVVGTSNLQGKIGFLYDTQTNTSYIQSMRQGIGGKPLRLNFAGGEVSVGRSNASANLEVNGTVTATAIATTSLAGTCISSSISSTSNNVAASSAAVKSAYDSASNANITASNALPKSGGTLTGALTGTSATFNSTIQGSGILIGSNGFHQQTSNALMSANYSSFQPSLRTGHGALCLAAGDQKIMFLNSNDSIMDTCFGNSAANSLRIHHGKVNNSNFSGNEYPYGITIDAGGSLDARQFGLSSNQGSTLYLNTARKGFVETGNKLIVNGNIESYSSNVNTIFPLLNSGKHSSSWVYNTISLGNALVTNGVANFRFADMRYNTSNGIYHNSNYMGIGFWGNDDILNVLTNRRVGINTTNPKTALEVSGQISVGNDGGWVTGGIRFQDTAGNNDAAVLQGTDGKLHFRAPSGNGSNGFEWWNGGATSSLMTLNNNGNVGIGINPTAKLHVNGNMKTGVIITSNTSLGSSSLNPDNVGYQESFHAFTRPYDNASFQRTNHFAITSGWGGYYNTCGLTWNCYNQGNNEYQRYDNKMLGWSILVGGNNQKMSFACYGKGFDGTNITQGSQESPLILTPDGTIVGTYAAPNRLIVGSPTGITGQVSMITAKGAIGVAYPIGTFMDSVNTSDQIVFNNTNGRVGAIQTTGSSTAYNTTSDYRLKENIHSMDSTTSMEKVSMLNLVTFTFKPDPTSVVSGFIAHEVKEVYPDPVTGDKDSVDENGNIIIQSMDYGRLTPLLCSALKGVLDRLNAIEAKLA